MDLDSNHYTDDQSFETLTGHMAKKYPIYNCFNDGDEALLIFQGSQSYVSPTWYDNLEAATWNYISIHIYGSIERLGDRYNYLKKYIGAIRIRIHDFDVNVQAAYKLSQDQTHWSRKNTIRELTQSGYPGSIAIANEMKER